MRFLIVHCYPTMIQALRELIQGYVKQLVLPDVEITDANGYEFTYPKAVQFLKRGYDCIFMNLGLPDELAHLSGAPTRIFVTSGWPAEFGPEVELFDQFVTVPMVDSQFVGRLHKILITDPRQLRRRLPTREHLDAAIIGILERVRVGKEDLDEALKLFADYRDTYLHPKPLELPDGLPLAGRIDYYAQVQPLNLERRLILLERCLRKPLASQVERQQLVRHQLERVRKGMGLELWSRRAQAAKILDDLDLLRLMVEQQAGRPPTIPAALRQSLLNHAEPMPLVQEALAKITEEVFVTN